MSGVLSIDLALCSQNLGIAVAKPSPHSTEISLLPASALGLADRLAPATSVANQILDFCGKQDIRLLLLDGPQGWKDPASELKHCRVCEKTLNTSAKTGTLDSVKPLNWKPFVRFSIAVFSELVKRGVSLAEKPIIEASPPGILALESFPYSAWRAVGLQSLPSKRKCRIEHLIDRTERLKASYNLTFDLPITHDQLQAAVASLAGVAILRGDPSGYKAHGQPPTLKDGVILEGYIVNPTKSGNQPLSGGISR
jgi:hypothetical protein